jgi:hypothetical protein
MVVKRRSLPALAALVVTESASDSVASTDISIDLRDYLTSFPHSSLVDLVLERADADGLFDARLRLQATGAKDGALPVAAFREVVSGAFFTDGYVHYRDMYAYISNIHEMLTMLRGLLDDGHPEVVIALAEQAIDCAEDALGYLDDSDGYMSGVAEDLQGLHLDACLSARPDPVAP